MMSRGSAARYGWRWQRRLRGPGGSQRNDALNTIQNEPLDLILVDWLMPDMDGPGLCRAIRTSWDVPIIVITSKQDGRSEALAAGANDYIRKPFALEELLLHIQSALMGRKLKTAINRPAQLNHPKNRNTFLTIF